MDSLIAVGRDDDKAISVSGGTAIPPELTYASEIHWLFIAAVDIEGQLILGVIRVFDPFVPTICRHDAGSLLFSVN